MRSPGCCSCGAHLDYAECASAKELLQLLKQRQCSSKAASTFASSLSIWHLHNSITGSRSTLTYPGRVAPCLLQLLQQVGEAGAQAAQVDAWQGHQLLQYLQGIGCCLGGSLGGGLSGHTASGGQSLQQHSMVSREGAPTNRDATGSRVARLVARHSTAEKCQSLLRHGSDLLQAADDVEGSTAWAGWQSEHEFGMREWGAEAMTLRLARLSIQSRGCAPIDGD